MKKSKYDGIVKSAGNDKLLWILQAVEQKKLTPEEAVLVIGQGVTMVPVAGQPQGGQQPQQQAQAPQAAQGQQ